MKTEPVLHRLPLDFSAEKLAQEVSQFTEAAWLPHPMEAAGDASIPLISVGGTHNIDYAISGPMQQTNYLARSPYLQQVLQAFGVPLSRCRLVRKIINCGERTDEELSPNLLSDQVYHWFRRRPIYVPVVTEARLSLRCHKSLLSRWLGRSLRDSSAD